MKSVNSTSKLREYEECPSCNRRIFVELFSGYPTCCTCRGLDPSGNHLKPDKGVNEAEWGLG